MKHNAASATITLVKRQIEAAVSDFRPSATPSDDSFKACAILFAALFVGPKPREIADTMGYDYDYVIEVQTECMRRACGPIRKLDTALTSANGART